ncbi:Gfo/Idh/MocA family oxidoreductase [Streptomyces sp. N2-109]|uniref:Gfo/Idh/MocA family oxidoreductase n=1 Tax=Streptomyces gossypii TaxID=2883101 RepID=A0ABT2JX12_9ACTN|nr:Gfo/Idh/MocA family oxidoreductase [Streptomyces gossypii]MCT2591994.1 Gfo/Idh/MocA family oxidoreductase [Streptomyces gossypii]
MARIGIVGLRRGAYLARWGRHVGLDIAALCERDPEQLAAVAPEFPAARTYDDWRPLLDADLDGVVLAHDLDQHVEPALRFLERGVHVLSEVTACRSVEEGRALVAADAASSARYSFAENYVLHPHIRMMSRLVAEGRIGEIELIEADYLHGLPPGGVHDLTGDPAHWRGRISPTEYCTHTLSPVLDTASAWPVEVSAFGVQPGERPGAVVLVTRLSSGALAVTRQTFLQGEPDSHWSWMSVRGTRGLTESLRAPGEAAWSVRTRVEPWVGGGGLVDETEAPPRLRLGGLKVGRAEEGTALVMAAFRDTVVDGAPPRVPVRAAVAASLVGVCAGDSLREGGRTVRLPDVAGW